MKVIYLLAISLILAGCHPPTNKTKDLDCEVAQPVCAATLWNGKSMDTSYYNSPKNFYYQIVQVDGLNTENQEFSIYLNESIYSNSKKQKANFATISDGSQQRLFSIENAKSKQNNTQMRDAFVVKDDVFPGTKGNIGFPIYLNSDELLVSTTLLSQTQSSTFNSDWRQLLPLEATIGQSRLYKTNRQDISEINTNAKQPNQHLMWESQPALDRTNNILFFASDREGGYGGVDIWYMLKNGENWSTPINAGANVNTECDDITPYITPKDDKLYFSTTGRDNIGGYDIFQISYHIADGKPVFEGNPKNLGKPINTEFDEISPFFPNYSESYFYYSSDQDGDFDIYVMKKVFKDGKDSIKFAANNNGEDLFDFTGEEDTTFINPTFKLEGIVIDNRRNEPVDNADVIVKKDQEEEIHKSTKTDSDGKYEFILVKGHTYKVEVKNDTLFNDSYSVFVDKKDSSNLIRRNMTLDAMKTVRVNFKYDQSDDPYEYILDSLGNQVNTTWQEAIDYLAEDIINSEDLLTEVVITGHTDPNGSTIYNRNLGQRRAEFVVIELTKIGVPIYLLKAKSKGKTEKLVRFDKEDDNQYHKRLRRVTLQKLYSK